MLDGRLRAAVVEACCIKVFPSTALKPILIE